MLNRNERTDILGIYSKKRRFGKFNTNRAILIYLKLREAAIDKLDKIGQMDDGTRSKRNRFKGASIDRSKL